MKTLLIGMDGTQINTFKRGWTPYLKSLLEEGSILSLKEDLMSRGWAELFTGEHAAITGAMYERPILGGTYEWTDAFGLPHIPNLGSKIKPIWQAINERGYRVGIMNVPTTYPAPQVHGFFVSGGGGGGKVTKHIAPEQCYPITISALLSEAGYIFDERSNVLWEEGYNPAKAFMRLEEMTRKRTTAFIDLATRYAIDFGFLVYRSTVMAETLALPELYFQDQGEKEINHDLLRSVKNFYGVLDAEIRRLVDTFPDTQCILVSDHGMAPKKWTVNFNKFLIEKGYQQASAKHRKTHSFVHSLKCRIPRSIRKLLKSNQLLNSGFRSLVTFDPANSKAFNVTYAGATHGVFINDRERFGGPIPSSEIIVWTRKILKELNQDKEVKKHGFFAYEKSHSKGLYNDHLPDIIVEMPDGYSPCNESTQFISPAGVQLKYLTIQEIAENIRVSVKTRTPLAVIKNDRWRVCPTATRKDLRVVYDHILKTFPNSHK